MNSHSHQLALRTALGVVMPLLLVTAALLPLWIFHARLPEPMASHWGLRGMPNGAMAQRSLAMLIFTLSGLAAVVMAVVARRRTATRGEIAGPVAVAGFVAGLIVVASWLTVFANLDAASWRQAGSLGIARVMLSLAAGGLLAAALSRMSQALEITAIPDSGNLPRAGLSPNARAVWVSSARAGWAIPLTIVGLGVAFFISRLNVVAGLGMSLTGVVGLFFTSIRMTVDRQGVRIAYGMFGWPVQHVELAEIRQATALHIEPMAWGGWGYRGSLKWMKRAAVVLRGGEGMKLELTGDRVLAITIDRAQEGAGVVNDLVATPTSSAAGG